MLKSIAAGNPVTLNIPFTDQNGEEITPTALDYRVLDGEEAIVKATAAIALPNPVGDEIEIVIAASYNTLTADQTAAVRTLELNITTAAGVVTQRISYAIRRAARLVVLKNSFQTWGQAQLEAEDIPGLIGWESADDFARQTALIEAFRRLTRLGYRITWPRETDDQAYLSPADSRIAPQHWPAMSIAEWIQDYPDTFRSALRRAQIVEADEIIGGDKVGQRRRQGVLSESIGESSMMFRVGKPLDLGISAGALECLTGFLDIRMTTTRS